MSPNSGRRPDRLTLLLRRWRWHTQYDVLSRLYAPSVYTVAGIELETINAIVTPGVIQLWCRQAALWRPPHLAMLRRRRYKMALNPVLMEISSQLDAPLEVVCLAAFRPGAHMWSGSPGAAISTSVWAGKGYPVVKT